MPNVFGPTHVAVANFDAQYKGQLTFQKGQLLLVTQQQVQSEVTNPNHGSKF